MEKREKERRDRTKVEFVSGTATKKPSSTGTSAAAAVGQTTSSSTDEERKRKSKWDQAMPGQQIQAGAILTAVATGTKTAIPAFGTLASKKPKQT